MYSFHFLYSFFSYGLLIYLQETALNYKNHIEKKSTDSRKI